MSREPCSPVGRIPVMRLLPNSLSLLAGMCFALPAVAQQPTADAIMARVAANQDASNAERSHFLYTQHTRVLSRTGKTIRCEETTDIRVLPTATGSKRKLLSLDGRLLQKGTYLHYTDRDRQKEADKPEASEDAQGPNPKSSLAEADDAMDRDLVENLRDHLTNDKSKDGVSAGLFPLTAAAQSHYLFKLLGHEPRNGHDCFHIAFTPRDKEDYDWKGDAWIDTTAYQPVVVRTALAHNIPFAVRTLLGTSVPGLGFTILYAPQPMPPAPDGDPQAPPQALWFPVSIGTEFKLHVLFFLNRQIVLNAENRDFERTHVTSTIHGTAPAE